MIPYYYCFWVEVPPLRDIVLLRATSDLRPPTPDLVAQRAPWSLNVACGAALRVAWTFNLWKQFCVCKAQTPLRMPLWRGADEAPTATEGQREDRHEPGESCDSGVEHLVHQRIFAEAHNLCG